MNPIKSASNIERQVMASVGVMYAARTLTGSTALKLYVLILSIWAVGRLVWVSKVFTNFFGIENHGLGAIINFAVIALEHAHTGVLVALLVALAAFISLVIDTLRSFAARTYSTNALA
jgi:hypothetical protein